LSLARRKSSADRFYRRVWVGQTHAVRRVAVVGCIGAGKSTVGRVLAECLGLEVVHLDRLWWQPGHHKITGAQTVATHTMPGHEFRQLEAKLAAREAWVIDGGVANIDLRLARADTVVFLDLPRWVCTWQLLKRHNRSRPDYPEGVQEGIGWLWLLIRWIWKTWPTERRPVVLAAIEEHAGEAAVFRLRTGRAVRAFLDRLPPAEGAGSLGGRLSPSKRTVFARH
jgi:adenylate kinase family enzyme